MYNDIRQICLMTLKQKEVDMLNNQEISEKLAKSIKEGPYKTTFYLDKLNMSHQTFNSSMNGKRRWTINEFVFLCKLFNLKIEDFAKN